MELKVVEKAPQAAEQLTLRRRLEQALDNSYVKIGALNMSREQGMPLITDVLLDTICEHIATDAKVKVAVYEGLTKADTDFDLGAVSHDQSGCVARAIAKALKEQR
jgi:hypothetical protein